MPDTTSRNNPNNIQRWRHCISNVVGSIRHNPDELGAILSWWIKATPGQGYTLNNAHDPATHKAVIRATEIHSDVKVAYNADGTPVLTGDNVTGNVWSYSIGEGRFYQEGSSEWPTGAIGVINDIDTPFSTDWQQITRAIFNIPSRVVIQVFVSNPIIAQNYNQLPARTLTCFYDNFKLQIRQPREDENSGIIRTVKRTDIEGEETHETPAFLSTSAVGASFAGGIKRWRVSAGKIVFDPTNGWKEGFYAPGEVSTQVSNLSESNLETLAARQLITQTTGDSDILDVDVPVSSAEPISICRGIAFLDGAYATQMIREDFYNNKIELSLLEIGTLTPPYVVTETVQEVSTATGGSTVVTLPSAGAGLKYERADTEAEVQARLAAGTLAANTLYGVGE